MWMAHLNHFLKTIILIILLLPPLRGGVVTFFDPNHLNSSTPYTVTSKLEYLIASDPISLDGMFHDWHGVYHPKSGENIALQDMRIDIGTQINPSFYVGYFYRYNVGIKTGKDFTDFFYRVKNHIDLDPNRVYRLDLDIEGVEQSGIAISHTHFLINNTHTRLQIGGAISLGVGHDMQEGSIHGKAKIIDNKTYYAVGDISSYYTHNYLYDLDVDQASAYGFGSDIAISYYNKTDTWGIDFLMNDLYSRLYWKDLPYSKVEIETENHSYDEDGYVHYSPSISGLELYRNFTQKISPRYRLEGHKDLSHGVIALVGCDYLYDTTLAYVEVQKQLMAQTYVGFSYEERFHSFEVQYNRENFSFSLRTDSLKDNSVLGITANYFFLF